MPYEDVPAFVQDLNSKVETIGRLSVLFAILTAARSVEVRKAKWSEIDLERAEWNRPASVMKSRRAHTVTLSPAAIDVLTAAAQYRTTTADSLIFPGKGGAAQSDMTLTGALRKAGLATVTVHGFRSSFRDWAAEQMPTIPDAVAEAALAHKVADATIAAYKRAKFLDLRRTLLDAWGSYVMGRSNVIRLAGVA
jgi:integrase